MSFTRFLILSHRYLGIGVGLLMVMWCLSGIVMMYVPFPELDAQSRKGGLARLDANRCCVLTGPSFPGGDTQIESFQIEMFDSRPFLDMVLPGGRHRMIDLSTGESFQGASGTQALQVAVRYADAHGLGGDAELRAPVETDQWTTGRFRGDRPLYRIALNDPAGTELYVSSTTGQAVQVTNAHIRFWNWLGAVPHWLYFTNLRENVVLWARIVIWTSLAGTVLTVLGITIGIRQMKRRESDGKLASPYRGVWYWHHVPGLIFGLFTFTWVLSGLLSMNPWGVLSGTSPDPAQNLLQGAPPVWTEVRDALPTILANAPLNTHFIHSARLDGRLAVIATQSDGTRIRLNAQGLPAPLGEADHASAAARIGDAYDGVSWEISETQDAYYYGSAGDPPPLPVLRIITQGKGAARFYLDPVSGELIRFADAQRRWQRWLFNGLHSLDFTRALRWRPAWDIVMIFLLLGVTGVCATGTYLGFKRLIKRPRSLLVGSALQAPKTRAKIVSTSAK